MNSTRILQRKYPNETIDLHRRIRMLSEHETRFFFAHRQHGCDYPVPDPEAMKRNPELHIDYGDFSAAPPVMYVIDEAHITFDARAWMQSGPHLTYYNSQHRKPGDEVFFVTQFVELLDKRCVGFSQDIIEVRNYGMERLSIFRGPKGQHCATWINPEPGAKKGKVSGNFLFRLDLEIANCYDTTSGVGISGRAKKPREKQLKGLNPVWAIVALVLAGTLVWYLPDLFTKFLIKSSDKIEKAGNAAISRGTEAMIGAHAAPGVRPPEHRLPDAAPGPTPVPSDDCEEVAGVILHGDRIMVAVAGSWTSVVGAVDSKRLLLENGLMVRRRDVANPPRRRLTEAAQLQSADFKKAESKS